MKKYVLLLSAGFITYLSITGYTIGPANFAHINCTGSYGSQASCDGSNCHNANDANVVLDITVKDLFGNTVNNGRYMANAQYKVIVSGHKSSGTYPKFSYSFSAASEFGTGGNYTQYGLAKNTTVVGQAVIAEPMNPASTTGVGGANNFADSLLWQAPPPGKGKWKLFATALLANDDATRTGDAANHYERTLSPTPTSVTGVEATADVKIIPNPVRNQCNIEIKSTPDNYDMIIYNSAGQLFYKGNVQVTSDPLKHAVDASSWSTGIYYLEIMNKNKEKKLLSFVKL